MNRNDRKHGFINRMQKIDSTKQFSQWIKAALVASKIINYLKCWKKTKKKKIGRNLPSLNCNCNPDNVRLLCVCVPFQIWESQEYMAFLLLLAVDGYANNAVRKKKTQKFIILCINKTDELKHYGNIVHSM